MIIAPERVDFYTTASVRCASGYHFGHGRCFQGDRLLLELDTSLESGERVEVRLTLTDARVTALLHARVVRALVTTQDDTPRWSLSVESVAEADRAALDAWLANQKAGGTWSRFDLLSTEGPLGSGIGASNTDVRSALARMARRTASDIHDSQIAGTRSDLDPDTSHRSAMRDALRRAVTAPGTAPTSTGLGAPRPPSAPSPLPVPPPPGAAALPPPPAMRVPPGPPPAPVVGTVPTGLPAPPRGVAGLGGVVPGAALPPPPSAGGNSLGLQPTAPRAPQVSSLHSNISPLPAPEPIGSAFTLGETTWLELRWNSTHLFAGAARELLTSGRVRVPSVASLPTKGDIRAIVRHGALALECPASLVGLATGASTYQLTLDASARALLAAKAPG